MHDKIPQAINFFSNVPDELILQIYSTVPSRQLYHYCRLINKQQGALAIIALLAKTDRESFPYQTELLRNLVYGKRLLILQNNKVQILLENELSHLLKSSIYSPIDKLYATMILTRLRGHQFSIEEAFISNLQKKLQDDEKTHSVNALNCCAALAPRLTNDQIIRLIEKVNKNVLHPDSDIRSAANYCFLAFILQLSQQQRNDFINNIIDLFIDSAQKFECRLYALRCLIILSCTITEKQLKNITPTIINMLEQNSISANFLALKFLNHFISRLKNVIRPTELVEKVIERLSDQGDEETHQEAKICLAALITQMNNHQLRGLIHNLINRLGNTDVKTRLQALISLKILSPKLEEKQVQSLTEIPEEEPSLPWILWQKITHGGFCHNTAKPDKLPVNLVTALDDNNMWVQIAAIDCLATLSTQLDELKLLQLTKLIKEKLQDENPSTQKATIKCLAAFALSSPQNLITDIADLIGNKLCSLIPNVRATALNALTDLVPYLDKQAVKFIQRFMTLLYIRNTLVVQNALNALSTSVTQLNDEQMGELLPTIVRKLNNPSLTVCATMLNSMDSFIIKLNDPQQITTLLDTILQVLNQPNASPQIQKSALHCLSLFVNKIDQTQLESLISLFINWVPHTNPDVSIAALKCVAKVAPYVTNSQRATISLILQQAKSNKNDINNAVINCLAAYANQLPPDLIRPMIAEAIELLYKSTDEDSCTAALKLINGCSCHLSKEQLLQLNKMLPPLLNSDFSSVRYKAVQLASHLLMRGKRLNCLISQEAFTPEAIFIATLIQGSNLLEQTNQSLPHSYAPS